MDWEKCFSCSRPLNQEGDLLNSLYRLIGNRPQGKDSPAIQGFFPNSSSSSSQVKFIFNLMETRVQNFL